MNHLVQKKYDALKGNPDEIISHPKNSNNPTLHTPLKGFPIPNTLSATWCGGTPSCDVIPVLDLASPLRNRTPVRTYKGVAGDLAGRYLNLYLLQSLNQPSGLPHAYCRHELPGKSRLALAIIGSNWIYISGNYVKLFVISGFLLTSIARGESSLNGLVLM